MGVKAELKAARARMQAGEPSEALSMIQQILEASPPDLQDAQTLYAVLVTAGMAGIAAEDPSIAERSFKRAAELIPDAPQAWKGLIDCLEKAGKVEALPECLARAAEIAEGKGNFSRARTLRVRLGTVLDMLGKQDDALQAVLHHIDNPEAVASAAAADGSPRGLAAEIEHLSLLLLAAVLEVDKEETTIAKRVERRLANDSSIGAGSGGGGRDATAGDERSRASALAFEYRAKALAKDAAAAAAAAAAVGTTAAVEDGSTTPVGSRLSTAMHALLEAAGQAGVGGGHNGGGGGLLRFHPEEGRGAGGVGSDGDAQYRAWRTLVTRFCRAYVGRAVRIAETGSGGGGGTGDSSPCPSSFFRWREVLTACAAVEKAVGQTGWDEGWVATAILLSSAYTYPGQYVPQAGDGGEPKEPAQELWRMAKDGAEDASASPSDAATLHRPWLKAEASLHLAGLALWAGDVAEADALLKVALAASAAAEAAALSMSTGTVGGVPWAGSLSGPGSDWRERTLRCLVDERLGNGGGGGAGGGDAGAAAGAAARGLVRVDSAIGAFDESFRLRGAPAGEGGYADSRGRLGLARASLLLKLGRIDEARSAAGVASAGVAHVAAAATDDASAERPGNEKGPAAGRRPPCLHCRALCVASELDLAEGYTVRAEGRLREVLAANGHSADALGRLGWLLLDVGGRGSAGSASTGSGYEQGMRSRREAVEAARPLLERAAAEEPGCAGHAFRLARCYWEAGGEYRENRSYCFNSLLKAAKVDPTNAEWFEWLGYWYQSVGGDAERARACFTRAVKLDPSQRGAGEALASLYLEGGQETLAVGLFRQCAAVSVACHWAWASLGRTKILEGKLAEAASHIQQAIRGCPTSWSYWSDLGWCYHAEGKQAAALKAYTRAEELLAGQQEVAAADGSPTDETRASQRVLVARVRVRTQVGTIQRQIGQVDEAVSSFKDALDLDPSSTIALEGAGEAFLAQAHARTSEGLYTAAATSLRDGCGVTRRFLAALPKAAAYTDVSGHSDDARAPDAAPAGRKSYGQCAWKLLGDLYTYAHKLPPMCFESEGARAGLGLDAGGEGIGRRGLATSEAAARQAALALEGARNRLEFVARGADAYRELVELVSAAANPEGDRSSGEGGEALSEEALTTKAAALYDLGLNYLLRARLVRADAGEGSGLLPQNVYEEMPEVVDLARSAEQSFKQSIEARPAYSDAWNGLGAVSRDPLIQQHCWIRAVQLEHNPSAWANLGMLYVRWGMDHQAYESFGGLQAVTDHPTMWVGLGLLKEKQACQPGVDSSKRRWLLSQASDAYYSSLETGQHVDGLLGLGTTAAVTHSQADAIVALRQHLDLSPHSAQAWNSLGAALELAGQGGQAVAAYRRALGLLEVQGKRFEGVLPLSSSAGGKDVWEEAVDLARGNLARALVLEGEAGEAVAVLSTRNPTQADNMLQLGRAHALLGDWDAALTSLEQVLVGVNGLVSAASVRYFRGDANGALAAARALMGSHLGDRRALRSVVSLAALAGDSALAQEASRALQALPKRASASDADGRLSRQHAAEEDLWAIHLAMRATGAPDIASRRALSKAVHLSPASISSWARLGAATADAAAASASCARDSLNRSSSTPSAAGGSVVSSKLAEVCLSAAEKQAMFALLGKARGITGDTDGGGVGTRGMNGECSARRVATTLAGTASAVMCGGDVVGKGKGKDKSGPRAGSRVMRVMLRAVHLYPGDALAWRCLATALVGDALSSASGSPKARDMALSDANTLYRGVSKLNCDSSPPRPAGGGNQGQDSGGSVVGAEAAYVQMLRGVIERDGDDGIEGAGPFASSLMAARAAVLGGAGVVEGDDAIKRYKLALRVQPKALVVWRELAACYGLSGRHKAARAALKCGVRASQHHLVRHDPNGGGDGDGDRGTGRPATAAAPLLLQMGAMSLSTPGDEDEALACIGDAFRSGRGGAAGHVLRGLANSRLGKGALAASAFARAREADLDPAMAAVVEKLGATQAASITVE